MIFSKVKRDANGRAVLTKKQQAAIDEAVRKHELEKFTRQAWGKEASEGWKSIEPQVTSIIVKVLGHQKYRSDRERAELHKLLHFFAFLGYDMASSRAQKRRKRGGTVGAAAVRKKAEQTRQRCIRAYSKTLNDLTLTEEQRMMRACIEAGVSRSTLYRAIKSQR